jgi:hypothetical protein
MTMIALPVWIWVPVLLLLVLGAWKLVKFIILTLFG